MTPPLLAFRVAAPHWVTCECGELMREHERIYEQRFMVIVYRCPKRRWWNRSKHPDWLLRRHLKAVAVEAPK